MEGPQPHELHRNNGNGTFTPIGASAGIQLPYEPGLYGKAYGMAIGDADADGDADLYISTCRVGGNIRNNFYDGRRAQTGLTQFVDIADSNGTQNMDNSYGTEFADFDDDGDLDLAVANNGGPLLILRNTQTSGAWLVVDVRTSEGAPAIGARVEIVAAGRAQRREVRPQSSYLSSHDPRAHFGLGGAARVDSVVVTWPDGARWTATGVAPRSRLRVSRNQAQEQRR
jgi:hypothetical protein